MTISFQEIQRYHNPFQHRVLETLYGMGCIVESMTYHDKLSNEMQERLKFNNDDITAIQKRTLEDRFVVHRTSNKTFELEVKTCIKKRHTRRMAPEALPLALHYHMSRVGVKCLYVYLDPFFDFEVGFWCDDMPRISCVKFKPNLSRQMTIRIKEIITNIFDYPIVFDDMSYVPDTGSPDPFALIEFSELNKCSHWVDLVRTYLSTN